MENKITVSSLATPLALATGKTKKVCEDFLKEFFRLASESLEAEEILKIKGFGTFKTVEVESRTGINVNTGERQEIASHKKVVFTPAKELASIINAPFEEFVSVEMDDEIPEEILFGAVTEESQISSQAEARSEKLEETERNPGLMQSGDIQTGESNEEVMTDENKISEKVLSEGSEEEGEDDEITLEAYENKGTDVGSESEETPDKIETQVKTTQTACQISAAQIGEPQEWEVQSEQRKSRFGFGFLTGALSMLVVCLVIFMLGCFFDWWPENLNIMSRTATQAQKIDNKEEVSENEIEPAIEEIQEPVYDTVSKTRFLTTIAREHYGDYNFWPYIYYENESILGHPDRITPGTQVVVPDLAKYGVDVSKKEDVEKAKKAGLEIYARFKTL